MSHTALNLAGYIDAGTGSYLLAAVASGAAGIWFYIRSKAAKITGRGKKAQADANDDQSAAVVERASGDVAEHPATELPATETPGQQ